MILKLYDYSILDLKKKMGGGGGGEWICRFYIESSSLVINSLNSVCVVANLVNEWKHTVEEKRKQLFTQFKRTAELKTITTVLH